MAFTSTTSSATLNNQNYGLVQNNQEMPFWGEVSIVPAGLDATTPQVSSMKVGFVQNAKNTRIWEVNNPTVKPGSTAPANSSVTVESRLVGTLKIKNYVLDRCDPQTDIKKDLSPLYDGYVSFDATGKCIIINTDAPHAPAISRTFDKMAVLGVDTWPVKVEYQWNKTKLIDDFLLWLVVFDSNVANVPAKPIVVVPIRQTDWLLHADSSGATAQHAIGGTDKDPDTVPVTDGDLANTLIRKPKAYTWPSGIPNTVIHP